MKRILGLIMALLLVGTCFAEGIDLSGYTNDELSGLAERIAEELENRENDAADGRAVAPGEPLVPQKSDETKKSSKKSDDKAEESKESEEKKEEAAKPEFTVLKMDSRGVYVEELQTKLLELGFEAGKVDGIFGKKTEAALKKVQKALGWEETGKLEKLEDLNVVTSIELDDGVNLARGTVLPITVSPKDKDTWCSPSNFYPTSDKGLASLADQANVVFTVSFDWKAEGADTKTKASICLKYTDSKYGKIGEFSIAKGKSDGHFTASFSPDDGMREFGTGWLISGIGKENRDLNITISHFKFERGLQETEWAIAPEDEGDGRNLATGTAEAVTVTPHEGDTWCAPNNLYPTSSEGLALLADKSNSVFIVSFDWAVEGADDETEARICLKYTNSSFGKVGEFPITKGSSDGHFTSQFTPDDGMREFGTGWLISGMGQNNRDIKITISNFKFEFSSVETEWTKAPEDE